MRSIVVALLFLFTSVAHAGVSTRGFIQTTAHTIVIAYTGCNSENTWFIGGVVVDELALANGFELNSWHWVTASSTEDLMSVLSDWFRVGVIITQKATVEQGWCEEHKTEAKENSI